MGSIIEAIKLLHAALEENHEKQYKLTMKREQLLEDEKAIVNAIATLVPDEKEEERIISKKQKRAGWKKGTLEASIASAMMTDPDKDWTVKEIADMISRPHTSIHRKMAQSEQFFCTRQGKGRRESLWRIQMVGEDKLPFGLRNARIVPGSKVKVG